MTHGKILAENMLALVRSAAVDGNIVEFYECASRRIVRRMRNAKRPDTR